jgi:MFS family permease
VSRALGITVVETSNLGSLAIAGAGVGCFLWSSLANVYGRRPVLVFAQLVAVAAGFATSFISTYRGLLGARFVVGLGNAAPIVLSAVIMGLSSQALLEF